MSRLTYASNATRLTSLPTFLDDWITFWQSIIGIGQSGILLCHSTLRPKPLNNPKQEVHISWNKLPPVHPGEILLEEFLKPLGISQYRLAKDTGVPARRINEIVQGKRSVTADTALRLSRYFGMSERFWLNLQAHYDLEMEKDRLGDRLENEVRVLAPP